MILILSVRESAIDVLHIFRERFQRCGFGLDGMETSFDVAQNTLLTGAAAISLARWRSKQ